MDTNPTVWDCAYRDLPVVVFGAAGFIGRWVARALSKRGAILALAVRCKTAAEPVLNAYGVSGAVFQIDLRNQGQIFALVESMLPAITFNLAAYGIDPVERDEGAAEQLNAALPGAIGEAMARYGSAGWTGPRLVHAGSGSEYGPAAGELRETTIPCPDGFYARTKLAGTLALERVCRRTGLSAVTARMFNVYGPGEHAGRLLPSIIDARRRNVPLPLSAGRQRRDFLYVEDAAEGLLRLGAAAARPGHSIVNLASGRLVSVREFAETAAAALSAPPSHLAFGALPTRPREPSYASVSLDLLREMTGWTPPSDMAAGIGRALAFEALATPGSIPEQGGISSPL